MLQEEIFSFFFKKYFESIFGKDFKESREQKRVTRATGSVPDYSRVQPRPMEYKMSDRHDRY